MQRKLPERDRTQGKVSLSLWTIKTSRAFVCVLYSNSKFPLLKFTDNLAYYVISEPHKAATAHNTMEQSPSSESSSSSAAHSITSIHETWRFNAVSTKDGQWSLSWARKVHSAPFHLDNINFTILFPSATRSSKMSLSFSLSKQNTLRISTFYHVYDSHKQLKLLFWITLSVCDKDNKIWSSSLWDFFKFLSFLCVRSKQFPQHPTPAGKKYRNAVNSYFEHWHSFAGWLEDY
jgi:hypothetical protein